MNFKIVILATLVLLLLLGIWWLLPTPKQENVKPRAELSSGREALVVTSPTPKKTPEPSFELLTRQSSYQADVPFTAQSPFAEWKDPRQQDACEEAVVLMANKWVQGETIGSKQAAKEELLAMSGFQEEKYGEYRDTSAQDTLTRIFKDYYHFENVKLINNISLQDILTAVNSGNLVITPMNGRALKNPFFTPPGPERHMVLIIGYDAGKREFITHDPGIAKGQDYHYPIDVYYQAIRDYPTGYHVPILKEEKNMIIVQKN